MQIFQEAVIACNPVRSQTFDLKFDSTSAIDARRANQLRVLAAISVMVKSIYKHLDHAASQLFCRDTMRFLLKKMVVSASGDSVIAPKTTCTLKRSRTQFIL